MRHALFLICVLGCARQFRLPMTAAEMAQHDSGDALVAYLGQRDASPAVCDLRAQGPHVSSVSPDVREALVSGLVDGKIDPGLWRRCVEAILGRLQHEETA